jgi:ketosteroid isomerase-like protein
VSRENVELIRGLQPAPDVDLAELFRDDAAAAALLAAIAPLFRADFEKTVVLVRDYGLRKGSDAEVAVRAAAVWTVREGKVARAEFYADRAEALEAVGLSG